MQHVFNLAIVQGAIWIPLCRQFCLCLLVAQYRFVHLSLSGMHASLFQLLSFTGFLTDNDHLALSFQVSQFSIVSLLIEVQTGSKRLSHLASCQLAHISHFIRCREYHISYSFGTRSRVHFPSVFWTVDVWIMVITATEVTHRTGRGECQSGMLIAIGSNATYFALLSVRLNRDPFKGIPPYRAKIDSLSPHFFH